MVRTGSRDEWEPGKSGFAHFFEHMMFRGTEKYPNYDQVISEIGAKANAWTSDDQTVFHINLPSEDLPKIIDLESDRFQHLKYSLQAFQTESGAVYGEFRKGRTSPWSVLYEELHNMAFEKHTYKHTTIGFEEDIKNMPNMYEYSISFFNRYYKPENIVIAVVGDFDSSKTFELMKKNYSSWTKGYIEPKIEQEPEQTSQKIKEIQYVGRTLPILMMAFKSNKFDSNNKNVVATLLLQELLFGETSPIHKKLVMDEQVVQFISPDFSISRDPKLLYIATMVKDTNKIEYVKKEIDKSINEFQNNRVDDKKLNEIKKRIKYQFLLSLDSPEAIASMLTNYVSITGKIDDISTYFSTLEVLTTEDIQNAAKYYFIPKKSNVVILKGIR